MKRNSLVELIPKRQGLILALPGLNSLLLETNKRSFLKIARCLMRAGSLARSDISISVLWWGTRSVRPHVFEIYGPVYSIDHKDYGVDTLFRNYLVLIDGKWTLFHIT